MDHYDPELEVEVESAFPENSERRIRRHERLIDAISEGVSSRPVIDPTTGAPTWTIATEELLGPVFDDPEG